MTYTPLRMMVLAYGIASCIVLNAHQSLKTDYWNTVVTVHQNHGNALTVFNKCDETKAQQENQRLANDFELQRALITQYENMNEDDRTNLRNDLHSLYNALHEGLGSQVTHIAAEKTIAAKNAIGSWINSKTGTTIFSSTPLPKPAEKPNEHLLERLKYDIAALDAALPSATASVFPIQPASWNPYCFDNAVKGLSCNPKDDKALSWAAVEDMNALDGRIKIYEKITKEEYEALQTERGKQTFEKALDALNISDLEESVRCYQKLIDTLNASDNEGKASAQNYKPRYTTEIALLKNKKQIIEAVMSKKQGSMPKTNTSAQQGQTTPTTTAQKAGTTSAAGTQASGNTAGGTQQTAGHGQDNSSSASYMPMLTKYAPAAAAAAICAGIAIALYIKYAGDSDDIDADEEYATAIAVYKSPAADEHAQREDEIAAA